MKIFSQKFLVLVFMIVICSGELFAQLNWTKHPGNPVLTAPNGWFTSVTIPCVIYNVDSSRYEMWFSGSAIAGGARPFQIGFAFSLDGISWTIHPSPVLSARPNNWDNYTVEGPSVIRDNGLYKMWYTAGGPNFYQNKIGYATSTDGINWDRLDNPVLQSIPNYWESSGVGWCSVISDADGYKMWYTGYNTTDYPGVEYIGYVTSIDGISWQRDTLNNPVLLTGASGQWDDTWTFMPRVLRIDNIYYMWYGGTNDYYGTFQIGLASSPNGINWIKHQANPVLSPSPGQWDGSAVEAGFVLMVGDSLHMWYDGFNGSVRQIGLATSLFTPLPIPPGSYTVGAGGNFATIQDAFNKLSTDGVAGNVTFELIDNLYTAPTDSFGFKLNGPIPGAGPDSRVTIQPAENKNVIIEGSGGATVSFLSTKYLTIDGVSLTGPTTLAIHSLDEGPFTWINTAVFFPPAANNIVENVTFNNENDSIISTGLAFMSFVNTTSAIDSNLIQNNFIKNASIGIYISGSSGIAEARDNIVRGNVIGSEADSLITWGIQIETNDNSIIENNRIENIKQQFNLNVITHGINICGGNSCIVRNNVVHKVRSSTLLGSTGILLSGGGVFGYGTNNLVYNNMIYDIQSTSVDTNSRIAGIQLWNQINPKIYYNSVSLSGTGRTCPGGSSAFFMTTTGSVINLEMINNIFVNTRNDSPYCASAICDFSSATFASNYNDLYFDDSNPANCLVKIDTIKYLTLADWQATGQDLNSVTEMPSFVDPYLHISESDSTYLESGGTPISGIETDYEGQIRNTLTPDIGADEFNGIRIPVELTSFTGASKDDEIILNWSTATETNNQGFEIERSKDNGNFKKIGFVPGFGTTTEPKSYSYSDQPDKSGTYYYRLKQVDYDGSYEYSDVVEVKMIAFNSYLLTQNFPNPFNPTTTIGFGIQNKSNVRITVLNVIGEEVAVVLNEERQPGYYQVEFNAAGLSSGVYFYRIKAENFIQTKKMILLR